MEGGTPGIGSKFKTAYYRAHHDLARCMTMTQRYVPFNYVPLKQNQFPSLQMLERGKRRNLSGIQHETSTPIDDAPGWNEDLASASEAHVKVLSTTSKRREK